MTEFWQRRPRGSEPRSTGDVLVSERVRHRREPRRSVVEPTPAGVRIGLLRKAGGRDKKSTRRVLLRVVSKRPVLKRGF